MFTQDIIKLVQVFHMASRQERAAPASLPESSRNKSAPDSRRRPVGSGTWGATGVQSQTRLCRWKRAPEEASGPHVSPTQHTSLQGCAKPLKWKRGPRESSALFELRRLPEMLPPAPRSARPDSSRGQSAFLLSSEGRTKSKGSGWQRSGFSSGGLPAFGVASPSASRPEGRRRQHSEVVAPNACPSQVQLPKEVQVGWERFA